MLKVYVIIWLTMAYIYIIYNSIHVFVSIPLFMYCIYALWSHNWFLCTTLSIHTHLDIDKYQKNHDFQKWVSTYTYIVGASLIAWLWCVNRCEMYVQKFNYVWITPGNDPLKGHIDLYTPHFYKHSFLFSSTNCFYQTITILFLFYNGCMYTSISI